MFVIIELSGIQYRVEKDQKLFVNHLSGQVGDIIHIDKVLLKNFDILNIGTPIVDKLIVKAQILGHVKDKKVIIFKKKRRKGYKVKNGHRQQFTQIQILSI